MTSTGVLWRVEEKPKTQAARVGEINDQTSQVLQIGRLQH